MNLNGKHPGHSRPVLTVILPVCNGGTGFIRCLRALRRGHSQPDEIIVAANGCRDRSVEAARVAGARVIETSRPVGPAAARNAAAQKARGNILVFLDADVAVHPDTIGRFRAVFRDKPDLAACFGSYDDGCAEKNFFSRYKNLFHHFIHQQADPAATTFWAGCGAIRKSVFETAGGFDERYRVPAIEDIELGYRLVAQGHQIRLDKRIQATHLKRWTLKSVLMSDIFSRALPWSRLIRQSRCMPNDLNTRMRFRLSALLSTWLGLCIPVTMLSGAPAWPALLSAALFFLLNADWYVFVMKRMGLQWAVPAMAWHWFYYLYSLAAYAWAAAEHPARFSRPANMQAPSAQPPPSVWSEHKATPAPNTRSPAGAGSKTDCRRRSKPEKRPLRILRIQVIDWALVNNFASAQEIDRTTVKYLQRMDNVVYSPIRRNLCATRIHQNLTIYPTRSKSKLHFFKDAFQMAGRLHRRNRYHLVYADDPMWSGLVGYLLKRRFKLRLLLKCHSDYYSSPAWLRENPRYCIDFILSLWMIRQADWITAVTREGARNLVRLGAAPERLTRLPTQVRTGLFRPSRVTPEGYSANRVLFVGRLEKQKGLPFLMSAITLLARRGIPVTLTVAGEGSQRPKLKQLVRHLGIENRVVFLGYLPHKQLRSVYQRHPFLVLPSLHEALGKVIIEAGLCGLPAIGTRVGGVPELIVPGKTGLLVPPGDVSSLAAAIKNLMDNPDLSRDMGRRAAKAYRCRFDFPSILDRLLETFSRAANRGVFPDQTAGRSNP